MLKIKEEDLQKSDDVLKIQFDNKWYYDIKSVATFLKEDLSGVESIKLPLKGEYKEVATLEEIEKGRKEEPLSEFNQALLKMKKFKK
ncbi:hypothetical protein FA048_11870 [Pedobacter polaris]|uniref:Uncharacterized protein n=1 Tax=Pedobacter polaris TaxID=2571273 RepID=A0A4U1CXI4_9SPHI|nr:hypothetical protein [Pedobacter polaris]TKC10858.1 hypothetical protein FA048_11870 [Pedobacter polaris]